MNDVVMKGRHRGCMLARPGAHAKQVTGSVCAFREYLLESACGQAVSMEAFACTFEPGALVDARSWRALPTLPHGVASQARLRQLI